MRNFYLLAVLFVLFSCNKKEEKKEEPKETPLENTVVEKDVNTTPRKPELVFTVQIAALRNKNSSLSSIENIKMHQENGLTKYRIGEFTSYQEAKDYKRTLRNNYPDAFVQALKDDNPIHISEALNN